MRQQRHQQRAGGWRAGLPILAMIGAMVCAGGCAGTPSGTGAAGTITPANSAATSSTPSTCANTVNPCTANTRVDAIAKIIAQTSNSTDAFVEFHDTSDRNRDGTDRAVQLACDPSACYLEVLCDEGTEPTCASLGATLTPMGFTLVQHNYNLDYSPGGARDFAVRTENIFRQVLGAAPDYQLAWTSAAHPTPTPVPTT